MTACLYCACYIQKCQRSDQGSNGPESTVETEEEDSIGFKSNLGKFTAPRAQSSQAPLLESADDGKGCSLTLMMRVLRPFPSEIAPGSRPDGVI